MQCKDQAFLQRWGALHTDVAANPMPQDWPVRFQVFGFTHALAERGLISEAHFESFQRDFAPEDFKHIKSVRSTSGAPQNTPEHLREVWNGMRLRLAIVKNPGTLLFHLVGFSEVLYEDGVIEQAEYLALQQKAASHRPVFAH
jgi:hypothetical protein